MGVCIGGVLSPMSVATLLKSIWDWTVCFSRGVFVVPVVTVSSWHSSSRLMMSSSSRSLPLDGEAGSGVRLESWSPRLMGGGAMSDFPEEWMWSEGGDPLMCDGVDLFGEDEVPCREGGGIVVVDLTLVVRFGLCFLGSVSTPL